MRTAVAIVTAACLGLACATKVVACEPENSMPLMRKSQQFAIDGPLSVDELEKRHMIQIRETGKVLPFGYANRFWVELKRMMQPGDEIYFIAFRDGRFYQDGHALVRNDCILARVPGSIT